MHDDLEKSSPVTTVRLSDCFSLYSPGNLVFSFYFESSSRESLLTMGYHHYLEF